MSVLSDNTIQRWIINYLQDLFIFCSVDMIVGIHTNCIWKWYLRSEQKNANKDMTDCALLFHVHDIFSLKRLWFTLVEIA